MFEDICYSLLIAIKEKLKQESVPRAFWNNFEICVINHDCLQRTAERWKHDIRLHQKFRLVMNNDFTVHAVFIPEGSSLHISLEGVDAEKYQEYRILIQSVIDQFMSKT